MCIGQGRAYEAACVLKFDFNISPIIDKTIVVSVYTEEQLKRHWSSFDIDYTRLVFKTDKDIPLPNVWTENHWYKQQAIKLYLLDTVDSDQFLIQDCDLACIKPFTAFVDNNPLFRVEGLWNEYQQIYSGAVYNLIGMDRIIPSSFVTEIMPYNKADWIDCRNLIQDRFKESWLDAIPNLCAFDKIKWFSEYELLGIFKTNKDQNWSVTKDDHPIINSWADFDQADWTNIPTIKFKARPLKFMSELEAHQIINTF